MRTFTRRNLLKQAAAGGAIVAVAPAIVSRKTLASSGELKVMNWSDYLPKSFLEGFEKKTGIVIKHTPYGSNEELLNKMRATKGRGFDLVGPTLDRAGEWKPLGLLQPFDMNRVDTSKIVPGMLKGSTGAWTWDGGNHHLPYHWGTEALSWRTDKWQQEYSKLSYGDLWTPEMKGKIQGRPHSMMAGIGLYLDASGKVPSNRMLDAYKDEANMRRIWEEITKFAVEHKSWVKQFWNDADAQINGLMQNDVVIGQTWEGPILRLKGEGQPVTYMAPQEGAFAWLDGLSMPIGAENIDEIYEYINYVYDAEVNGLIANETSYNPVAVGAEEYLNPTFKKNFSEAYPGDALDRLWWWPPSEPWYTEIRAEYSDKFVAA
ncbi:extracellular solute-binding protein [Pelagibius sp. 7325]|uniref:extracellular solute-binding protein n=1 Tax=Pelagibius sp. 7325 TaxID=3131994 RepID=UPI0030ECF336